jgi:hypothetical protein
LLFSCHADQKDDSPVHEAVAILYNAAPSETLFTLPPGLPLQWDIRFTSSVLPPAVQADGSWLVPARSLALLTAASK